MPEDFERVPETGYYVYGVVPVSGGSPLSLRGIDEAPVELVPFHDVAAAASVMALDRPP